MKKNLFKKEDILKLLSVTKKNFVKNAPQIFVVAGSIGVLATFVMIAKETPEAVKKVDDIRIEDTEPSKIDKIRVAAPVYAPSIVLGGTSLALILSAHHINAKRIASLTAAYNITKGAFGDYKEKVEELIGDKKKDTLNGMIAKDKLEKNPIVEGDVLLTGLGDMLCYDYMTARYFRCDINTIKKAENILNREMMADLSGSATLNDFYSEINLPSAGCGNYLGWKIDDGLMEIDCTSMIAANGEPCIVLNYIPCLLTAFA